MSSRTKHFRAHQEFALACRALGFPGVRCSGGMLATESLPGLSVCIRRTERLRLEQTMNAMEEGSWDALPVLAHRSNRHPWRVTMRLDVFLRLYRAYLSVVSGARKED